MGHSTRTSIIQYSSPQRVDRWTPAAVSPQRPLPTSLLGFRLVLQVGPDNKAAGAAALPPKP